LHFGKTEIFLVRGLDKRPEASLRKRPDGQINPHGGLEMKVSLI